MKKLLLIDDDRDLLKAMSIRLKSYGYNIVSAVDAVTAISTARKESPDAAILDLGLPGGDGFVVLDRLRALDDTMPVVVLSARDPQANEMRALKAGAKAFFQKPADNEELLSVIGKVLGE